MVILKSVLQVSINRLKEDILIGPSGNERQGFLT